MDHLAKLYYNKYIDLQERYYQLMEDGADRLASMSESEFEDFIKANPGAEELARKKRAEGQARKTKGPKVSETPKPQSESTWEERETRRRENRRAQREAEQAKPKTEAPKQPKPESAAAPSEEEIARNKAREQYAKEWAQKQKEAEAKKPKPGAAKPKSEPTVKSTESSAKTSKPSIVQKTTNLGKGLGKGLAGFGVGLGGYLLGKQASDVALGAAGIENETAKEVAGEAVGGAAGGVAATGVGSLMAGAGLPTAAAVGGAALKGGLVGLAAYGGLKAGQAIADIEVDEKGTQVSDVVGKKIYDIYGKMTGKGTSSEQLNTPKTGVAGGDKQKMAQNSADEAEEEFQKKAEMEKRKAAIRARRAMEK